LSLSSATLLINISFREVPLDLEMTELFRSDCLNF